MAVTKVEKDIEEMVRLLKRLSSADRREVRGILIGLQLANEIRRR